MDGKTSWHREEAELVQMLAVRDADLAMRALAKIVLQVTGGSLDDATSLAFDALAAASSPFASSPGAANSSGASSSGNHQNASQERLLAQPQVVPRADENLKSLVRLRKAKQSHDQLSNKISDNVDDSDESCDRHRMPSEDILHEESMTISRSDKNLFSAGASSSSDHQSASLGLPAGVDASPKSLERLPNAKKHYGERENTISHKNHISDELCERQNVLSEDLRREPLAISSCAEDLVYEAISLHSRAEASVASSASSGKGMKRPLQDDSQVSDFFVAHACDQSGGAARKKSNPSRQASSCFVLRGNPDGALAQSPPLLRHILREDQRRSLQWMLDHEQGRRSAVKGGILADKMGYGKTATTIGLLSLGLGAADGQARPVKEGYIPCKASLIIAPSHLIQQWKDELKKFLGHDKVQFFVGAYDLVENGKHRPSDVNVFNNLRDESRASFNNVVRVFVLRDHYDLNCVKGSDFDWFHIVLISYAVQAQPSYAIKIRKFLEENNKLTILGHREVAGKSMPKYKVTDMNKKMELLREFVRDLGHSGVRELLERNYPLLELFWWKRVVMDEFHESESWVYRVREMVKSIGADFRWGLSGTPPVGTIESIFQVARALWYEGVKLGDPSSGQLFLDCHVLQNASAEVEAIGVEEHIEFVQQTPAERAIYRQACRDEGIFDLEQGYDEVSIQSREALLKACAHFAAARARRLGNSTAQEELERLGDRKRQRIKDLEEQIWLEMTRAHWLGQKCMTACVQQLCESSINGSFPAVKDLAQNVKHASNEFLRQNEAVALAVDIQYYTQDGELREQPRVVLRQPIQEAEYYLDPFSRHTVTHEIARNSHAEASMLLGCMQMCTSMCCRDAAISAVPVALAQLLKLLDTAHRSLRFFECQLQSMKGDGASRTCSICLDEDCELSSLCILPCGHLFHIGCVVDILKAQSLCPECRAHASASDISSLKMELAPPKQNSLPMCKEPTAMQKIHGAKFCAVAETLRRIRQEDSVAKALLFVQWSDLEWKVAEALVAHQIPFLQLPKPPSRKSPGDILKQFQEQASPWVMILSLERAAAGANLTSANHVLFVHPMNAETVQVAVAYEKQAIARVRRIGQQRPSIHVHRFIATGTVEEHIANLHQGED